MFWYLRQHLSRTKNLKAKSWQFIGKYCSFVLQQKLISTQTVSGVMKLFKTQEHRKSLRELQTHSHSSDTTRAQCSGNTSHSAGTLHLLPTWTVEQGLYPQCADNSTHSYCSANKRQVCSVLQALPQNGTLCKSWELPAREKALKGSMATWLLNIRQV